MKGSFKRIKAVILVLVLLLSINLPVFAAENTDFIFDVIGTQARITGYTGSKTEIEIPASLNGRIVTEIGSGAFVGKSSIQSVKLPETIRTISQDAFKNCASLKAIVIPSTVTAIAEYAFAGCVSLTEIIIQSALTSIGHYSFEGCTALKEISIPSTKIGFGAFKNCTALESIQFLQPVQSLGREAFHGTAWYNTQPKGLLTVGTAVYSYNGTAASVVIPEGIRTVADYAFYGTDVSEVVVPDGLYYIGNSAFGNCDKLNYLSLPASVISIGLKAIGYNDNTVSSSFVVYCKGDSDAYKWAKGNNLKTELIDVCTHFFGDWQITSAPDCTNPGQEMHRCKKCNFTETRSVDAKGHSFSGWVVLSELSCLTDGVKRRTCTVCGVTEDDVQLTKGHSWDEWTVILEPDCTNEGERKHTCTACGVTESVVTTATGHEWIVNEETDSYGWIVQAMPGCIIDGIQVRTCSVCSETEQSNIEAIGHKADEWVVIKDPTAVTEGTKQGVCLVCGELFTQDIPKIEQTLPDNIRTLTLKKDATVYFDSTHKCILGVEYNTTVSDVLLQFMYPGHILVTDIELQQKNNDDIVGTGSYFVLVRFNNDTQQYEPLDAAALIIKGDVSGDGKLTAADARLALQSAAKTVELQPPYLMAADIDGDGNVTAAEARKILRVSSKIDTFD